MKYFKSFWRRLWAVLELLQAERSFLAAWRLCSSWPRLCAPRARGVPSQQHSFQPDALSNQWTSTFGDHACIWYGIDTSWRWRRFQWLLWRAHHLSHTSVWSWTRDISIGIALWAHQRRLKACWINYWKGSMEPRDACRLCEQSQGLRLRKQLPW